MMHSSLFLSDAVVRALGWTLVHTLWQGSAIALVLWLVLPRLRSAKQRYRAAYSALLCLAIVAAATFVRVYQPAQVPVVADAQTVWMLPAMTLGTPGATLPVSQNFWAAMASKLEVCHPVIVALWLPGFLFFLLRLAGGLHYVQRLRRRQTRPAGADWQDRLRKLTAEIGYTRPVVLLESALIRVPMALGFFKPMILLPIGLANQLSPAEVEAVLAHELAHLARRDWLFNLLQTLIEAVFYFHPAVWWISATIRAERENCCDDTAVALTGNRLAYAKTLAHLQDLARNAPTPNLALSLNGTPTLLRRRPLLLERIKRILHQPQPSTTIMEKTIALVIFSALIVLFTLRANTPPALAEAIRNIAETPKTWLAAGTPQETQVWQTVTDSVPKPKKERGKIVHDDGNQRVEMEMEDGKMRRLIINGKEIPATEYDQYSTLTKEILRDATPPPAPPAPPGIPGWEPAPAPPDAPRGWNMPAPRAPFPPHAPSSSIITTDVDDQGNTVIRLEQNGNPMEIRVKNDEVWVDGKKLEKGEKLDIPGIRFFEGNERVFQMEGSRLHTPRPDGRVMEFHIPPAPDAPDAPQFFQFSPDGGQFLFDTPEGAELQIREFFPEMDAKRIREEALRDMEQQRRQIEQELCALERERTQSRTEWKKSQKEAHKALEEAQRALEKAERAQRAALDEQRAAAAESKSRSYWANEEHQIRFREQYGIVHLLEINLQRDELVTDPNNFSVELSGKTLHVNGKKQSDATHKRYLELYRGSAGKELGKRGKFHIEMKNGKRTFGSSPANY
ncbi:MAG: M48 family metalloprotease [Lewinellaceae bacterium]|nr:M48 family metalloprotease [Lewinellaceae bacterium]